MQLQLMATNRCVMLCSLQSQCCPPVGTSLCENFTFSSLSTGLFSLDVAGTAVAKQQPHRVTVPLLSWNKSLLQFGNGPHDQNLV